MTYKIGDEPVPGYQLVAFVGRGNSGDVWKALGPGRVVVALKIIPLDSKLGRRERKAILGLRNFNDNALVNIYGLWFKDRAGQILEYSEELEDDTASVSKPLSAKPTRNTPPTRPGPATPVKKPAGIGRPPVAPSPGYLGQTIDPDAAEMAFDTGAPQETSASGLNDSAEPATAFARETEQNTSGTASGSQAPGDQSKTSSKNATELVVAMTLGDMTLGHRLEQCTQEGKTGIPLKELQRLMRDSARGIDYLNSRHFQHCDIKPENMLIVGNGAKICDFGLARPTKIDPSATVSPNGFTWACAAPEQLQRGRDIQNFSDHTDQYSLATSYYYLRTGRFPFDENNLQDLIDRKTSGRLDLSSSIISKRERLALAKALAVEPTARYPTAADFVEALEQAVAPAQSSPWRSVVAMAMVVLLIACLGLGGWVAYNEFFHSPQFIALQQRTDSGDYDTALEEFARLTSERERRQAEELLLAQLRARIAALGSDQCAELDQLLQDNATVVSAFEGPAREQAQTLLTELEERRSQVIPAAVRNELARYLSKREFTAADAWRQSSLPTASACDQAVQTFVRDEVLRKWISASGSDAEGERAEQVLTDWPTLSTLAQTAGRSDYQERLEQIRATALRNTRLRAQALLASENQADLQASLPLWKTLAQQGDASTPEGRDDRLSWLVAEFFTSPESPPLDTIRAQLAKLGEVHTNEHPARWHLLEAAVANAQLQAETKVDAATLQQLIEALLALRNQSPESAGRPLTSWEQQQQDAMTAALDGAAAKLSPAEQAPLLTKLEQLRAGAGLSLRIAQIRQLLLKKELEPARELIATTAAELSDPATTAKLAELTSWANLLDDQQYLPDILPPLLDHFVRPAGAISAAELAQAINTRAIAYGEEAAEYDYAIQLYSSTRQQVPNNAALEQAYYELLERRLIAKLKLAKDYHIILADATALLQLNASVKPASATLPLQIIAAAWVEAAIAEGKNLATDAQAKQLDVLAIAKRPLTATERQNSGAWAHYPTWLEAVVIAPQSQAVDSTALQTLYKEAPENEFLNAPARRAQTAQRVKQSLPVTNLPSDREIPWRASQDIIESTYDVLQFVQQLAKDTSLDEQAQARLQATLAIAQYYRQIARQEPPAEALALASEVLANDASRDALPESGMLPGLLAHLQYVRARAALATLKALPTNAAERTALLDHAAAAVEAAFDFPGYQRVASADAQEAADVDLYFSLVEPALRLASKPPTEDQQPALAILNAAQARIIERSSGVRSKLLREPGAKLQTLFEKTRDSYALASQWEARPAVVARNNLHWALALLDWHGSRSPELREALPNIIAGCESAAPDWHGTYYLQGMQHLYASRELSRDLCNIAQSAAEQKKELDLAEQALQKAIASPTLTAAERAEYRPRYYVGVSAINLERAFIRTTVDEKVPILMAAREQAGVAIAAANEHPRKLFLDQAYLAEGNPHEDLALHCGRTQFFNESEQSFKNAQTAAGSGWLQSEASFHLGRAQLRNALRTIPRQEGERLVAKLAESEASLIDARDNLPKLGKPHLLAYAIEANIHLAGVYMELAEFYAGRKEFEKSFPYIAKADEAYLAAVTGAAESAHESWSDYQATWLRRALKRYRAQRQQDATDASVTRKLVERLANELLSEAKGEKYPVTAEHRALAVQALMDLPETKTTAPILAELRAGRVPRGITPAQVTETQATLAAKQKIVEERLAVFGDNSCDDMTMAALGVLFDLHQQCSRLPQFASVRQYCSQAVDAVADRLAANDWKHTYAKAMAIGYRGLAGADPLLIGLPREQRKAKTAEYLAATKNLLQAIAQLQKLAAQHPTIVERGLLDEEKSTDAFRLAVAELMLEVADFAPKTSLNASAKLLLGQAKSTLQESLGRAGLTRHQKVFESALGQLDSHLE